MTAKKLREFIKEYPSITTVGELARLINSQNKAFKMHLYLHWV